MTDQAASASPRRRLYRRRRVSRPRAQPRLEPNAQYIGTSATRGVAISVGWSRSATIILSQISLLAFVFTFIVGADKPYKAIWVMLASSGAGLIASIAWIRIALRTGQWVEFDNRKLAELERIGRAMVPIFSSVEFERIARGFGAGAMLKLFSVGSLFVWMGLVWYVIDSQYPNFLGHISQELVDFAKQLLKR